MKSSQNLLLLLVFFAFAGGQPRSARQDGAEEQAGAAETLLLDEEKLEVAAEVTPGDIAASEESDLSEGTPEPEPEPHPETEPEPEPKPEGSTEKPNEKVEDSDDMGQQTNTSKKCQKCFRSAFRARNSEFCDGCGDIGVGAKPLEKDADRLRRKCRRCSNPKFAEKHHFCTIRCKDLQQASITSEPTPTPEPEHRPITSEDLKKTKKKKDRKKGQKKTNKKKGVQLPEDESSSQLSVPLKKPIEEQELGPLENLIKYIIHQNTFTR